MKCPGQDMQYWKGDAIYEVKCPKCTEMIEFYKDDTTRKCHHCDHRFVNPKMDFGCATYCQFAEQCLGTLPEEFVMEQDNLLKDKVAVAMKRYYQTDFKSIGNATRLARYAEKIGRATENANLAVILCSAYLYNIGSSQMSKNNRVVTPEGMHHEGVAIASEILNKLGAADLLIQQVCDIVANIPPENKETAGSFNIVIDARRLTNLEDQLKEQSLTEGERKELLKSFVTEEGKKEAEALVGQLKV